MKIGINGICGRMGRSVLDILLKKGHELSAAFDSPSSDWLGKDAGELISQKELGVKVSAFAAEAFKKCDCVIDFSSAASSMGLLGASQTQKIPLVIGTTGFSDEQKAEIERAASATALLFSPNMSVAVNLLFKLTEFAAAALKDGFDAEILEIHHKLKKDAPSGTAKRLAEIVKDNMRGMGDARILTGRGGIDCERGDSEIGVMALRGGDAVGEHTVYFIGEGERLELTIRSTKRDTLASGAVLAAEFLAGKGAGLYSMYDVIGL
ncbi:MAG: 4-hydroxy-tetrahydrodipicolinate reductase [Leptospirales bacterium]|nr:4-hydroxy-tetrahydrodipicolinate reductase [Leptospirales bacterium]